MTPALLSEVLAKAPAGIIDPNLLVGNESCDDAAVYRLNAEQALVATTDFFMPIVDDPFDFGRISAANALSDVYAMGARPIMALAVCGMPVGKLTAEEIARILAGGQTICIEAGIPIAGGHSIDSPEPIYGLVALGLVHPDRIKRNDRARAGDILILGKALGVGILSAALKKNELSAQGYAQMVETTTRLNTPGIALSEMDSVHALTDVTGFGLLGHLLEICKGSSVAAQLRMASIPVLSEAGQAAQAGHVTGASARNWSSVGTDVDLAQALPQWQRNLLTDPQTSGGLLVACSADSAAAVLGVFRRAGFAQAAVIGSLSAGSPRVAVR
ncbi:MAG: selenide, water dikinase SelD [Burkholderiales bacterium]